MKTYLECIPCFFRQALEASRLSGAGYKTQRKIVNELAKALPVFSLASSPPEMGRIIYGIVRRVTGREDPYSLIKTKSNRKALRFYSRLKRKVSRASDPLRASVALAIAGNVIDYGVKNSLNVDVELKKILKAESRQMKKGDNPFFQYGRFRNALARANTILYLADNAGEVVFDRILIEGIKKVYPWKRVIFAVKDKPTINDALLGDALTCGIDGVAEVVSNGSDAPGTVLPFCSPAFRRLFRQADMVISKGQGNFESLSNVCRPVFFLFMAKCTVVRAHVGCVAGEVILKYHSRRGNKQRGGRK